MSRRLRGVPNIKVNACVSDGVNIAARDAGEHQKTSLKRWLFYRKGGAIQMTDNILGSPELKAFGRTKDTDTSYQTRLILARRNMQGLQTADGI